jgi:diguanylate cyclase (GGDEF)-like protein
LCFGLLGVYMWVKRRCALLAGFQLVVGLAIFPYLVLPQWVQPDAELVTACALAWLGLSLLSLVALAKDPDRLFVLSLWLSGPLVAAHALVTPRLQMQVLDGLELLILGTFAAFAMSARQVHVWLAVSGTLYLAAVTVNPAPLGIWLAPVIVLLVVTTTLVVVRLLEMVRDASSHDPLTGALNRYGLKYRARSVRSGDVRKASPTSLGFFDVDGFKRYNDTQGHAAGDRLLIDLVADLRRQLRAQDLIARLGGDEFVVVFAGTPVAVAADVVDRLTPNLPISCSVGVVEWPAGASLDEALDCADALMYSHKRASQRQMSHSE